MNYLLPPAGGTSSVVERHLAKVDVASSSLVSRSKSSDNKGPRLRALCFCCFCCFCWFRQEDIVPEYMTAAELLALVDRVFQPRPEDTRMGIMIDLPDASVPDDPAWKERREIAAAWASLLGGAAPTFETKLLIYQNAGTNNGDLPCRCWIRAGGPLPLAAEELDPATSVSMEEIFDSFPMIVALTKFSSTAPLKLAARSHPMRAATMPGFSSNMIPALRLDYAEVDRRVRILKDLLDRATGADFVFRHRTGIDELHLDLRHRTSHASSGLLPERGVAGNLPSGEAYIVPYEGEIEGDPSLSRGILPVQFREETVRYEIAGNKAVRVLTAGPESEREAQLIEREPAYANIAELGLGVLAAFGVKPVGSVLLDEKLGLHIAFGRSDHFGGQVGPAAFSSPQAVVHIDRVYVPETQPDVRPESVKLGFADGSCLSIMREGEFENLF